jgi:hypothetical protein
VSRLLVLVAALGLTACGTVRTYRFPLDRPAAPSGARPAIFMEGTLPRRSMRELAMIESVGSGTKANAEDVVYALQDEAVRFGADAVVRVKVDCAYAQCHAWGVAVQYMR